MTYEELKKLLDDPDFNESQFVDFKADVTETSVPDLAKDISSFANAKGGRIFIGIKDDKTIKENEIFYPISGWASMDAEDLSNATRRKISRLLSHNLHFTVTPVKRPHHNNSVLIINIFKSETICGYLKGSNSSFEFWHRTDRQNSPMGIAEIVSKSLGSHHYKEQLIISREFAKLLIRRFGKVAIAIHQAYQNKEDGKFLLGQLIPETSINKIGYLKEMVISESNRTYANLASLAFLSANINSNLKQLAISLTNKLAEVISDNSAWNIDNNQLDKLKQSKINFQHDLRLYFYENSNALLIDYQNLLDIKKEIDQMIDDFEATGSSPT